MRTNPLYALIGLLLLVAPAVAQVSKSTLATDISTSFPDQNTGAITPATTRSFLNTLVNSFQQYTGIRNVTGATDTITAADYGQLILYNSASAVSVTIPQATGSFATFNLMVRNLGAGTVTVTPTVGTINGSANLSIVNNNSYQLVSDGTNWQIGVGGLPSTNPLKVSSLIAGDGTTCNNRGPFIIGTCRTNSTLTGITYDYEVGSNITFTGNSGFYFGFEDDSIINTSNTVNGSVYYSLFPLPFYEGLGTLGEMGALHWAPSITAGTVTSIEAINIKDAALSGGGAVTNQTGLVCGVLVAATNNLCLEIESASEFRAQVNLTNMARTITSTSGILDDLNIGPATATITGTTTIARLSKASLYQPTFTDASAVTITNAATLYVDNAPSCTGSVTCTRTWSLMTNSGNVWFNGNPHILVGSTVPADWPADVFVLNSTSNAELSVDLSLSSVRGGTHTENIGMNVAETVTGALTTWDGIVIQNLTLSGGGTVTNEYGLRIKGQTQGGTINQAIYVEGTGLVGFGTSNAQTQLHVSANAASIAPISGAGPLYVQQVDGSQNISEFDAYGTAIGYSLVARVATGTAASPTAVGAGQFMFNMQTYGRDNSAWSAGSQGGFSVVSVNQWSTTDHSTTMRFFTTATASTSQVEAMRIQASSGVSIGNAVVGTDPGAGGLIANGATIRFTALANTATTSAVCYNTSTGLLTYDSTIGTCNTSDESLKEFEGPLTDSLQRLVALSHSDHFGYFEWNDPEYGSGRKIGIGAQTAARIFPELTATGSNGLMSLAYDKLTVPIISALAELDARMKRLEHAAH